MIKKINVDLIKRHTFFTPLALQSTTSLTIADSATAADLVTSAVQLSHIEEEEEETNDELLADINLVMARVNRRTPGRVQELFESEYQNY